MKKTILSLLIVISIALISSCGKSQESSNQTAQTPNLKPNAVKVIYFMSEPRCPTCQKIEMFSKEIIQSKYKDKLSAGDMSFEIIDYGKPENKHFEEQYSLYTKSLLIIKVRDGQEKRFKNLEKVWELTDNKEEFAKYIQSEIDNYLKGM